MGFFDTVKAKAGDLAADAERASRIAAIQARIAVMQQDLKKAEKGLGQVTFALVERGDLTHPELLAAIDEVRAAQAAIDSKEAEIAQLRAEDEQAPAAEAPSAFPPPTAETPVAPPPIPAPDAPGTTPTPPAPNVPGA